MSSSTRISFENRDKYIEVGLNISFYRKRLGLSQEQLAEKVGISRAHLGAIEAPSIIRSFSLEILFNLARVLNVNAADLLEHRK